MRLALALVLLAALAAAACSGSPTSPGAAGSSFSGNVQPIVTNAPGGIPVPVPTVAGISCPSQAPSFRVEINSYGHIDFDWGHNAAANQIQIQYQREEYDGSLGPVVVIRELEERPGPASGNGSLLHHLERRIGQGIYKGWIAYELGGNCGGALSNKSTFRTGWLVPAPVAPQG